VRLVRIRVTIHELVVPLYAEVVRRKAVPHDNAVVRGKALLDLGRGTHDDIGVRAGGPQQLGAVSGDVS
jgi:hypothetical protein